MKFIIINTDHHFPPYWATRWAFKSKTSGSWQQCGGWEQNQKYATKYDSEDTALGVMCMLGHKSSKIMAV